MSNELKECPFCDGVASVNRYGNSTGGASYTVWCNACSISTAWMNADTEDIAKARAVSAWNRRSTSGAASGEVGIVPIDCRKHGVILPGGWNMVENKLIQPNGRQWYSQEHVAALQSTKPAPAEQSAPPVPPMDQPSCIPPSRAEPAVASDQLVTVLDALEIAHDLAVAEQANITALYAGYKPHKHEAAARDVATVKAAIRIVEASRCRAQGGITNDNDSNSLATQSASTAPGQAEIPAQTGIETVPAKTGTSNETKGNGDE